jgi:glycosyltransferase involved in cell wall biosynthesis
VPAFWNQISFAREWIDRLATLLPAHRIFATSRHVARLQEKIWPHRQVIPVWPGVDLRAFSEAGKRERSQLRAKLGLSPDGPLAVMVGRLQRWKGMHTAIAAMLEVRTKFSKARLVIVGGAHDLEPNYLDELKQMISTLGLADSVILAGRQDNVPEWMSAADVVVHASREEPFGMVAVEAMACGRAVITGNDGGVVEAVSDGVEGIHVPFGDHQRLAKALVRVFEDPETASGMGYRGIERARLFSRGRFAEDICREFEGVVGAKRKSPSAS